MRDKLSIEVEGKTVKEAVKNALKELKFPRNKVKIEILSEEKKGLFGMPGAKPAKVRISIKNKKEISKTVSKITDFRKSHADSHRLSHR